MSLLESAKSSCVGFRATGLKVDQDILLCLASRDQSQIEANAKRLNIRCLNASSRSGQLNHRHFRPPQHGRAECHV